MKTVKEQMLDKATSCEAQAKWFEAQAAEERKTADAYEQDAATYREQAQQWRAAAELVQD